MKELNFVSIDFETANERPDSVCSLGIVTVEGGRISDKRYRLIRPPDMRFSPHNVRVHGILPDEVAAEPEFFRYWKAISELLTDKIVIAHNAEFDFGVLRAVLKRYNLAFPDLDYSCSLKIARRLRKGLSSYSLNALADHIGYSFKHHHALEDAEAAAVIMLNLAKSENITSVEELNRKAGIATGFLKSDGSFRKVRTIPQKKRKLK